MERRLAAILAADVVGYTRLMGVDEAGTLRRLTELRQQVLEPLIAEHRGRVVKLMGDGLLVEFASMVDAITCAVAWQNQVAQREEEADEDKRLQFRIGVNLGDVIVEGEDIHGDGVNIAARLEGLADPGGICLSGDAYRHGKGKVEAGFEDLGEHDLKNVAEPVQVFRITATPSGIGAASPARKPLALPDKPSVAVLPFANLSGDPEQDYFADGITEDIITALTRFRSLFVIARNSSFRYKGQSPEIQEVGRDLDVTYVLEGSVRKAGNRIRITVQLIEVDTGHHIWAERYDRMLGDVFLLQDELTGMIASTLTGRLADFGRQRALDKRSKDLAIYDYLLLGDQCLNQGERDDILQARGLYEKAIKQDPSSARAYAGLARTYMAELYSDWTIEPKEVGERALSFAQKAAALDDLDSHAHIVLADAHLFVRSNFEEAEIEIEKALELNPNWYEPLCRKTWILALTGRANEGIVCAGQASRINPFGAYDCRVGHFIAAYSAQRYEEAISALRSISAPGYLIKALLAACHAQLGREDEARQALTEFVSTAHEEIAAYPGDAPDLWRRYWARHFPFKDTKDSDHLLDGLRKAGLPV